MKPLWIFDLDGTLSLADHRTHFIHNTPHPDWRAFYAACSGDRPNTPVIDIFALLRRAGADVWIWTGRSDEVLIETRAWLAQWVPLSDDVTLKMRRAGDFTPDTTLKAAWLAALPPEDYARLVGVFEDRGRVAKMWRDHAVTCFQVAEGEF